MAFMQPEEPKGFVPPTEPRPVGQTQGTKPKQKSGMPSVMGSGSLPQASGSGQKTLLGQ